MTADERYSRRRKRRQRRVRRHALDAADVIRRARHFRALLDRYDPSDYHPEDDYPQGGRYR